MLVEIAGHGLEQECPVLHLGGSDPEVRLLAAVDDQAVFPDQQVIETVFIQGIERRQGHRLLRPVIIFLHDREPVFAGGCATHIFHAAGTAFHGNPDRQ